MSLTGTDLQAIRMIVREEQAELKGKVTAVENDVKEIYFIVARLDKRVSRFGTRLTKMDQRITSIEAAAK